MRIYIKFMVSIRCKMVVKQELEKMGIEYITMDLGMVDLKEDLNPENRSQLELNLKKSGLELMDAKGSKLVHDTCNLIIQMIHYSDGLPENFTDYISRTLNCNYINLSRLFPEIMGISIQNYIIAHKIEKIKELLQYEDLSLTEISYQLGYSSVAHLSKQFKSITGLTPTFFKNLKALRTKKIAEVEIM